MAEYKKKSVSQRKKRIKNSVTEKIPMQKTPAAKKRDTVNREKVVIKTPQKAKPARNTEMKVVQGYKNKIKKRRLTVFGILGIVLIFVVVFALCLPTGLFEFFENRFALIGSGSGYPVSISSGGALVSTVQGKSHYIAVTAGSIDGYNNNGKLLFSYPHGYEYPVIKQSEERFMLYSIGDNEYSVYNLNKRLYSGTTDNKILAAAIAENGNYAVATQSDSYSSQVTVFDKNNKQIYKWMCADFIVNNVVLSPDGKNLAVSVFNTQSGKYLSKLYILGYNSATPKNLFEYEDEMIMSLSNAASSSFYAVFENSVTFYKWKDLSNSSVLTDKKVFFARNNKNYTVLVNGNEANKTDNEIVILNGKGEQKAEFAFSEEIIDIALRGKYIYILSDRMIYIYNVKGEVLNSVSCDFGVKRILPIASFSVATFTDNNIKKVTA